MLNGRPLTRSFFNRNTLTVCAELLGKRLVRRLPGNQRLAGIITEVEAYRGEEDQACHAKAGRTPRNQSMWGPPGRIYMFFTYGMHWMLNVVTEPEGVPAAILIRGLLPTEGLQHMQMLRPGQPLHALTDGPAKLCQAFNLDGAWDGYDLTTPRADLLIETTGLELGSFATTAPRVGLNNVPEPWKSVPWRFRIPPEHFPRISEGGKRS